MRGESAPAQMMDIVEDFAQGAGEAEGRGPYSDGQNMAGFRGDLRPGDQHRPPRFFYEAIEDLGIDAVVVGDHQEVSLGSPRRRHDLSGRPPAIREIGVDVHDTRGPITRPGRLAARDQGKRPGQEGANPDQDPDDRAEPNHRGS